ncbi:cyclic nucleotide-gated olfactory channel [Thecamonas trahens ATCC 50062]|uniref:Cyclic nucleotide-gated olfactory channel n=1 Tax=Thecamonas trahens ATCC 50062 TaxID=461836 RepID=A0A0L0DWI7_THETB|nr:cyclic nucleotide-gated olfactory channel [Thecamonas trahens ATCC 50062]KNC56451.1 cyclic nucleotide-gated olfactory channel [Thecamonas trahens ATCC 50062]|eukprot:XP_013760963.1 cyclic nucleotide-gated olfactory channel [Thecamonas trahens ATCC 50062]
MAHWTACCFFYLVYRINDSNGGQWPDTGDSGWAQGLELYLDQPTFRPYMRALFWSTTLLTGMGPDHNYPQSDIELVFMFIVLFMGIVVFAAIIGNVGSLIANSSATKADHKKKMDIVNLWMRHKGIAPGLQARIRSYYEYLWQRQAGLNDNIILMDFPEHLRALVSDDLNKNILREVPMFKALNNAEPFIQALMSALRPEIYTPGDYIVRENEMGQSMFFITRGIVDVITIDLGRVAQLGEGQYFGEKALLFKAKRNASIVARTYVDVFVLEKDDVDSALTDFPLYADELYTKAAEELLKRQNKANDNEDSEEDIEQLADKLEYVGGKTLGVSGTELHRGVSGTELQPFNSSEVLHALARQSSYDDDPNRSFSLHEVTSQQAIGPPSPKMPTAMLNGSFDRSAAAYSSREAVLSLARARSGSRTRSITNQLPIVDIIRSASGDLLAHAAEQQQTLFNRSQGSTSSVPRSPSRFAPPAQPNLPPVVSSRGLIAATSTSGPILPGQVPSDTASEQSDVIHEFGTDLGHSGSECGAPRISVQTASMRGVGQSLTTIPKINAAAGAGSNDETAHRTVAGRHGSSPLSGSASRSRSPCRHHGYRSSRKRKRKRKDKRRRRRKDGSSAAHSRSCSSRHTSRHSSRHGSHRVSHQALSPDGEGDEPSSATTPTGGTVSRKHGTKAKAKARRARKARKAAKRARKTAKVDAAGGGAGDGKTELDSGGHVKADFARSAQLASSALELPGSESDLNNTVVYKGRDSAENGNSRGLNVRVSSGTTTLNSSVQVSDSVSSSLAGAADVGSGSRRHSTYATPPKPLDDTLQVLKSTTSQPLESTREIMHRHQLQRKATESTDFVVSSSDSSSLVSASSTSSLSSSLSGDGTETSTGTVVASQTRLHPYAMGTIANGEGSGALTSMPMLPLSQLSPSPDDGLVQSISQPHHGEKSDDGGQSKAPRENGSKDAFRTRLSVTSNHTDIQRGSLTADASSYSYSDRSYSYYTSDVSSSSYLTDSSPADATTMARRSGHRKASAPAMLSPRDLGDRRQSVSGAVIAKALGQAAAMASIGRAGGTSFLFGSHTAPRVFSALNELIDLRKDFSTLAPHQLDRMQAVLIHILSDVSNVRLEQAGRLKSPSPGLARRSSTSKSRLQAVREQEIATGIQAGLSRPRSQSVSLASITKSGSSEARGVPSAPPVPMDIASRIRHVRRGSGGDDSLGRKHSGGGANMNLLVSSSNLESVLAKRRKRRPSLSMASPRGKLSAMPGTRGFGR